MKVNRYKLVGSMILQPSSIQRNDSRSWENIKWFGKSKENLGYNYSIFKWKFKEHQLKMKYKSQIKKKELK